jgi:small subunit ribosomal protein S20
MPKLKSSIKRLRQANKAAQRNKAVRTLFRSTVRKLRATEARSEAEALLSQTMSVIDKTVKKGVIHERTGARYKSRLAQYVDALEA